MNDGQNQIIIYRSPLSSTFAFFHAGNLDGAIQVNAILATHPPNNSLPANHHHEGHEEHEEQVRIGTFTTCWVVERFLFLRVQQSGYHCLSFVLFVFFVVLLLQSEGFFDSWVSIGGVWNISHYLIFQGLSLKWFLKSAKPELKGRRKITYRFWQDTALDCHPVMYGKEVVCRPMVKSDQIVLHFWIFVCFLTG
jgi:hypothetical protein